jgi:hypothetical protein
LVAERGYPILPPSWARAGILTSVLAILFVTLAPAGEDALVNGGFLCLACGAAPTANLLRNIILFLPVGFFVFGWTASWIVALLAGGVLSATIELLQFFIPGRNPFLVDVLANTTGAGVGAMFATAIPIAFGSSGPRRRLFAAAVASSALAAAAPGLLLTPDPPEDRLWMHWNHPLTRTGGYDGPILETSIGNLPLRPGRIPDHVRLPDRLLAGRTLSIRMEAGNPVAEARGLLRVVQGPSGRELFILTVHGTAVTASLPVRADRAGLTRPRATAPGVLGGALPGDTVLLLTRLRPDGGLRIEGPGARWDGRGPDPSNGWSLLYVPPGTGPRGMTALGFLWCAVLLLLPAAIAPGPGAALLGGLAVIAAMAVFPLVVPFLAPVPLAGWAGAATGWLVGRLTRRALVATVRPGAPDPGPPARACG